MAKKTDKTRQRFPNLSKLSIAILEVKKPYAQKEIADSLANELSRVERGFLTQNLDQNTCSALLQLPIHNLPSVQTAI